MVTVQVHNMMESGVCTFCNKEKPHLVQVTIPEAKITGIFDRQCFYGLLRTQLAESRQFMPQTAATTRNNTVKESGERT